MISKRQRLLCSTTKAIIEFDRIVNDEFEERPLIRVGVKKEISNMEKNEKPSKN